MNDEIKEILDKTKRWCDLALDDNCNTIMYKYEFVAILDYITKLQKENERLTRSIVSYDETLAKRNNEYEDYKLRIDKAIKYIEKKEYIDYNPTLDGSEDDSYNILPRSLSLYNEELDRLLNILQGVDKE